MREVHEQPLVKGLARKNESLKGSQATRKSRKKTEFFLRTLRPVGVGGISDQ